MHFGSTANFLFLGPTALILHVYQKNGAVTMIYVVLEKFIERVIR